jgi:hypothetical protein
MLTKALDIRIYKRTEIRSSKPSILGGLTFSKSAAQHPMHNLRPFPWICQTESADAHHCVHFQFPHNIKQKNKIQTWQEPTSSTNSKFLTVMVEIGKLENETLQSDGLVCYYNGIDPKTGNNICRY